MQLMTVHVGRECGRQLMAVHVGRECGMRLMTYIFYHLRVYPDPSLLSLPRRHSLSSTVTCVDNEHQR